MDQMDTHNNKGRMDQMDPHTTTRAGWARWTHTQSEDQMDTHTIRTRWTHTHYKDQIGPRRDWKVGKDGRGLHAETPSGSHTPKCITTGAPGRAACMPCIRALCALLGSRVRKNTIPHYQCPETGMQATLQTLPRTETHAQPHTDSQTR